MGPLEPSANPSDSWLQGRITHTYSAARENTKSTPIHNTKGADLPHGSEQSLVVSNIRRDSVDELFSHSLEQLAPPGGRYPSPLPLPTYRPSPPFRLDHASKSLTLHIRVPDDRFRPDRGGYKYGAAGRRLFVRNGKRYQNDVGVGATMQGMVIRAVSEYICIFILDCS